MHDQTLYIVKGPHDDPPITNGRWIETEKKFILYIMRRIKVINKYEPGAMLIYMDVLEKFHSYKFMQ